MFDNEYLIHWWTEVQRLIFVTLFNYKQVKNLADLYKAGFSEHKGKTQS